MEREATPEKINAAIEAHVACWWTPESEAAVVQAVGESGLALIKEMESCAGDAEIWQTAGTDIALAAAERAVRKAYPFLSETAIARLVTGAAYGWK